MDIFCEALSKCKVFKKVSGELVVCGNTSVPLNTVCQLLDNLMKN